MSLQLCKVFSLLMIVFNESQYYSAAYIHSLAVYVKGRLNLAHLNYSVSFFFLCLLPLASFFLRQYLG